MKIEEDLESFLDNSLGALRCDFEQKIGEVHCAKCGMVIRYPVIARRSDIRAFQELLRIAEEYLNEQGVPNKILCDLIDQINLGLTINKAIENGKNEETK